MNITHTQPSFHMLPARRSAVEVAPRVKAASTAESTRSDEQASRAAREEIRKLEARDAEVRAHEQAHAAAGGAHTGAPNYKTERGPDGRTYAVDGEVAVDVSAVAGDPQATLLKMQQVKRAALAPANPSAADRAVASKATARAAAASREIAQQRTTQAEAATGQDQRAYAMYAMPLAAKVGSLVNLTA